MKFKVTKLLTALACLYVANSVGVQAAEVNYQHKDIIELTAEQKTQIQVGIPDNVQGKAVVYVYQKNDSGKCDITPVSAQLPNTGVLSSPVFMGLGVVLLATSSYLVLKNRKGAKVLLLLAGASLIGNQTVSADIENFLRINGVPVENVEQIASPITDLDCYDYVGYIIPPAPSIVTPPSPVTPEPPVVVPEVKKGSVIVRYLETGTDVVLKEEVKAVTDVEVGLNYDVTDSKVDTLEFENTTYYFVSTTGQLSGQVVEGLTVITHYFEKGGKHTRSLSVSIAYNLLLEYPELEVFYKGEKVMNTSMFRSAEVNYYLDEIFEGEGRNGTQIMGLPITELSDDLTFAVNDHFYTYKEFSSWIDRLKIDLDNSYAGQNPPYVKSFTAWEGPLTFFERVNYPTYGRYNGITHDEATIRVEALEPTAISIADQL